MTPHVNILIATPGHSLMGEYVLSLLQTLQVLNERGITWAWANRYASHVGDAREITLANSMHNDVSDSRPLYGAATYDKIMWIDSDIAWTPDDFMRLYESEFDVVTGAYMLASGAVMAYPDAFQQSLHWKDVVLMTEPIRVHSCGFGFLAVKQGIFERLSRPWFQSVTVTMRKPDSGEEFQFPVMGEDLSWCERVNRLGYEIWLDPSVRVTHHKMVSLGWEGTQV